jgi:hypothetical protein
MPVAAIRPDDWNLPLFLHVLGAMLLVGSLIVAVTVLVVVWSRAGRDESAPLTRFGFLVLLVGVVPSYFLMRIPGEWIESKEFGKSVEEPGWVGVGYITADLGLLLLVVATVLAGIAARRARRTGEGGGVLVRISGVLASLLLVAYIVTMWAMTAKPGS